MLDPQVLCVVDINPESRVKAQRGPAAASAQQAGYTPVLIKVINQATSVAKLHLSSSQAGPSYAGVAKLTMERERQQHLRENENVNREERFLEIEAFVASQPTVWPTRRVDDREVPFVQPLVRAAAVDAQGQLWISMSVPYTYVYDRDGDKVRTVQFSATGIISPTSLFFTRSGRLLVTPGCFEFDPGQS